MTLHAGLDDRAAYWAAEVRRFFRRAALVVSCMVAGPPSKSPSAAGAPRPADVGGAPRPAVIPAAAGAGAPHTQTSQTPNTTEAGRL